MSPAPGPPSDPVDRRARHREVPGPLEARWVPALLVCLTLGILGVAWDAPARSAAALTGLAVAATTVLGAARSTERIRVLVADDEVLIRGAVEALLALEEDLEVLPGVSDGIAAVAAAQEHRPDVCLLDLEMPGLDGVEAARQILRSVPTKVVIFTRHARPGVLRRALAEQVSGFVPKSTPAEELAVVLRQVVAGRRYVDPEIAASALTAERSPLTERELDVLRAGRRSCS